MFSTLSALDETYDGSGFDSGMQIPQGGGLVVIRHILPAS